MFLFDPFGNALEFKSFSDHAEAFVGDDKPGGKKSSAAARPSPELTGSIN